MDNIIISGFADEISSDFKTQLKTVTALGMKYISLRSAYGKNIADYTVEEVKEKLLPLLNQYGVGVSSIGSPLGKIMIDDEKAYAKQLAQLDELCRMAHLLDCRYIRIFSFYMLKDHDPDECGAIVIRKLRGYLAIAEKHDIILIHENEKDIFGDTAARCRYIMDNLRDDRLKSAFDFANFVQCGEDPLNSWNLLADTIVYIHIKDALFKTRENVLCGTGDGRIAEILKKAIREEGYRGFLTLEPHLFIFDTLSQLETADTKGIIRENKAKSGGEGYAMQYKALLNILHTIGGQNG